jgi:dephospho-CoA kinase
MRRNSLSRDDATQRIRAQMPSAEKRRFADYEINTSGTLDDARRRAEAVFSALQTRARASAPDSFPQG